MGMSNMHLFHNSILCALKFCRLKVEKKMITIVKVRKPYILETLSNIYEEAMIIATLRTSDRQFMQVMRRGLGSGGSQW